MGRFIGENKIQEIQEKADIVQVISQHVLLKKAGANYKGLCPFHPEKTPSLSVSREKQIFHCFGCGAGGDVFHFLMRHENMSFPEAVKLLANRVGITLPEEVSDSKANNLREDVFRLNTLAAEYFQKQLIQSLLGEKARDYLKQRGFSQETAVRFKIGFAPDDWNALSSYLVSRGFSLDQIEKAGFAIFRKDGKGFYDRFRNRLIFPIFNSWGEVIAFGGRILGDATENVPKYLNSPETLVYKKGKTLYGLNWAKEAIRKENRAIIAEGYLDLIRLAESGFNNVVATLGTALTREQVQLLKGFAEEVVLVYDGDQAGKKAMERGQELLIEAALQVKVVPLPDGNDPDSFIRKKGQEAFLSELEKAKVYPIYFMEQVLASHRLEHLEERIKAVQKVIPVLSKIPSYPERAGYTKLLSERIDLPEEAIMAEMRKTGSLVRGLGGSLAQDKAKVTRSIEYQFCQIVMQSPELIRSVQLDSLFDNNDLFQEEYARQILDTIFRMLGTRERVATAEIVAALPDEKARNLASEMALEPVHYENPEVVIGDFLNFLKRTKLQQRLSILSKEIRETEGRGEFNKLRDLQKEYQRVKTEMAHLY